MMSLRDPHHPMWELGYLLSVFVVFYWRLRINASSFDSTEIATITESGMWAVGAVGALMWFRHRHKHNGGSGGSP